MFQKVRCVCQISKTNVTNLYREHFLFSWIFFRDLTNSSQFLNKTTFWLSKTISAPKSSLPLMSGSFHFWFFGQSDQKRKNQLSCLFIFSIKKSTFCLKMRAEIFVFWSLWPKNEKKIMEWTQQWFDYWSSFKIEFNYIWSHMVFSVWMPNFTGQDRVQTHLCVLESLLGLLPCIIDEMHPKSPKNFDRVNRCSWYFCQRFFMHFMDQ